MKKLISCLLVVMILLTAVSAFADSVEQNNVLTKFVEETNKETQDIALQVHSEGNVSDLVIRGDGTTVHFVARENGKETAHVQVNPTGIYVSSNGEVTMMSFATMTTILQDISNAVSSMLEAVIESIPEEEGVSREEVNAVLEQLGLAIADEAEQEQADAAVLSSAAMSFGDKFKPENILDVKEEDGVVEISLRSEALAIAFAEAVDELMLNDELAEIVDRDVESEMDITFTDLQKQWLLNRDEILNDISNMEATQAFDEDGHFVASYKLGEEDSMEKILVGNTDAWIDPENGEEAEIKFTLGFKDEDPFLVHETEVYPEYYHEKLTSGDSFSEVWLEYENQELKNGKVVTVIEDQEVFKMDFGPDYMYLKGLEGGLSTSVRETWNGKTRYELIAENDKGEESSVTVDFFYDLGDLVCELNSSETDESVKYVISRINKLDIEDLSTAKNLNEITVDSIDADINAELDKILSAFATEAN